MGGKIKIHVMHCGKVMVDEALPFANAAKNPLAYTGLFRGPFRQSYDLFGDASVILIWLPGHSDGMTGVLIQNNGRFVLLTGDCGYASKSWNTLTLPGITEDRQRMMRSPQWVKAMSEKDNCIEVLANHDPEVEPHVIEL